MKETDKKLLRKVMDTIGIKDSVDDFIDHLLDHTRLIAEYKCKTTLDNLFINRIYLDSIRTRDGGIKYWLILFWSGDNHPRCQKIYANNYRYELSDMLVNYRDYKLNKVLLKDSVND